MAVRWTSDWRRVQADQIRLHECWEPVQREQIKYIITKTAFSLCQYNWWFSLSSTRQACKIAIFHSTLSVIIKFYVLYTAWSKVCQEWYQLFITLLTWLLLNERGTHFHTKNHFAIKGFSLKAPTILSLETQLLGIQKQPLQISINKHDSCNNTAH